MARNRGFHGRSTTGPNLCRLSRDRARGDRGTWSRLRRARTPARAWSTWKRPSDEPIKLPDAEQMIDELDRIMTAYGTISVKTPDVWGQDRLAKFRSEYESQMAAWLKVGFKTDINASVRRSESEATRVQVGDRDRRAAAKGRHASASHGRSSASIPVSQAHAGLDASSAGMERARRQGAGGARVHRGARRAFELPESPEPVEARQCGRRPGRQAGLWPLPGADPGDAVARTEEPPGQRSDHHGFGEVGHDQAHAAQRAPECGGQ